MGSASLDYKGKLYAVAQEVNIHLLRLEFAFFRLQEKYKFPLDSAGFRKIVSNENDLSFADQIIYRFSKAQDAMGAKLFKAFLLYQGDDTDKPFLDILNSLEKARVLKVDDWMVLRDLRNEIAHNYGNDENQAVNIINAIYTSKDELKNILLSVAKIVGIDFEDNIN